MDEYGQNATVTNIDSISEMGEVAVLVDGKMAAIWLIPGHNVFHRKPDAPPKPKRKVVKTFKGFVTDTSVDSLDRPDDLLGDKRATVCLWWGTKNGSTFPATITIEVEE
jgi:hypothetical protein